MRIDFIGHATLLIRAGDLAVLTDPWWAGPAYHGQWFAWPFPTPERVPLERLDAIYLSHGHEDHLHPPTLASLPKDTTAILPRSFEAESAAYVRSLGFTCVVEVPGGASHELVRGRSRMKVTIFTHLGDSIAAFEADGQTVLDVNDALHCARDETIDAYAKLLAARFPRIDALFCGFGGASWFPNNFRVAGKNDAEVAARREEMFLRKFARLTDRLAPRHAFPFAAHFVLPDEPCWWISEQRLAMPPPARVIEKFLTTRTPVHDLQPGDFIEDGRVHASPPIPVEPADVRRAVLERHPQPAPPPIDLQKLTDRIAEAARRSRRPLALDAIIRFREQPRDGQVIRVRADGNGPAIVRLEREPAGDAPIVLETRGDLLETAVTETYGRDLLCIGYGGIVHLAGHSGGDLADRLLALITPFPTWVERLKSDPRRSLAYLARDPGARLAARTRLGAMLGRRGERMYGAEGWLST